MKLVSVIAVIGTLIGGVVLSLSLAQLYPSVDPLNRLYGAVFLSVFVTIGMFVYSLTAQGWQQMLLRSYGWWPIPLLILFWQGGL
ncbi:MULTISPECIES: hypothetical protein [Providencia]|uniref:Uncharacterized protein n=1 Tax=Providencia stuartii TaxID=588 RepID=A0ABD5L5V7_PROST|nr:hypothetical protein [Providencia sp. PROV133]ELR5044341.1 hypothetical protein [Providencia rettgeri]ELR5292445.1 hypothetical protein [Providencia stuartii]MCR4181123.1 hypothetical protein [Providencia vermicola]URE79540.1 hypothetical protein MWH14_04240 [Providencia stuartii]